MSNEIEELEGSELGTKEYWDTTYKSEIENYKSHGDIGEIWFDEDSQFRVIRWMIKNNINFNDNIVDLGCGNGMMLIELAREGYRNLTGLDYSATAIELAENIAKDQEIPIKFKVFDLLNSTTDAEFVNLGQFKVVHDKGTYDAISLHPENPKFKREIYIKNVHRMISDDDGIFIVTSCNWTESELIDAFQQYFCKIAAIPAPSFKFGGNVGSVVTSIVLKKI